VRTNPGQLMSANIVIGEVVHLWLRDEIVDDAWRIDQEALHTLGRMGGPSYVRTRERIDFVRGRQALSTPVPWSEEDA